MIKIHGFLRSRASRCLWMLEELGQEYELVEVQMGPEGAKDPEYLAINPNGRVPTMVDGDTVLWESMAINLYLTEKYDGGLKPKSPEDWGRAFQWSFWGMLEAETNLLTALFNVALLPEDQRDAEKAEAAVAALQKPLGILNGALEGRSYLLDSGFSVADLNLAAIFSWGKMARLDMAACPHLTGWLNTCLDREAYQRIAAKMKG